MASEYTSNANNAVDASKHVGQFSNCEQATHAVPLEVHNADSSSIRMRLQEVLKILNFVEALDQNTWIFYFGLMVAEVFGNESWVLDNSSGNEGKLLLELNLNLQLLHLRPHLYFELEFDIFDNFEIPKTFSSVYSKTLLYSLPIVG